jgi:hypothetical protein
VTRTSMTCSWIRPEACAQGTSVVKRAEMKQRRA